MSTNFLFSVGYGENTHCLFHINKITFVLETYISNLKKEENILIRFTNVDIVTEKTQWI